MALISTDVAGMALSDLQVGLVRALEERHDLLRACPARVTDKPTITYNFELSGSNAVFHGETDSLTPGDVKPRTIVRPLQHVSAPFEMSRKAIDLYSSETDQFEAQVRAQMRALGRKIAGGVATGDGTGNNIFGLDASNSRTVSIGGTLTRGQLDKLIDKYKLFGSNWAFVGNADVGAVFRDALTGSLTNTYQTLAGEELNVPTYRNIPFLTESSIATASNASDLFLVNLDLEEGFGLMYGLVKEDKNLIGNEGPIAVIDMMYQGVKLVKTYVATTYVQTVLRTPQACVKATGISV